jgi:hypothetical protein
MSGPVVTRKAVDIDSVGAIRVMFGKYKGTTIADVYALEPDYLRWLAREGRTRTASRMVRRVGPAAASYVEGMQSGATAPGAGATA